MQKLYTPRREHDDTCAFCLRKLRGSGIYLREEQEEIVPCVEGNPSALSQWCSQECMVADLNRRLCEKVESRL